MPISATPVAGAAPTGDYDADIIILARDRFHDTLQAVASARAQRNVTAHVWVLDQGSAPGVANAFAAVFSGLAGLSYYQAAENAGVGAGRNFLAGLGRGRIIVGLDNDAMFAAPDVVAGALAGFIRDPGLAATGFKILAADGARLDHSSWGYPLALLDRAGENFSAVTFVGAGHAIRRAAWEAAGGYDPTLFFTWEEYDFCLTAIAQGWRINYDGTLAVIHKVSAEARIAWSAERARFFCRNRLLIARRWDTGWPALAPRIAGYLLRAGREGHFRAALAGVADAIRADARQTRRKVSPPMRAYLAAHDGAHRGNVLDRLRREVLRRPAGAPATMECGTTPR